MNCSLVGLRHLKVLGNILTAELHLNTTSITVLERHLKAMECCYESTYGQPEAGTHQ